MKNYAVIGHPIGHTMSPFIHSKLFELAGIEAQYSVFDIPTENLENEFKNNLSKLDGFNITIPHKRNIIPFLDELDQKAELYQSVNTVCKTNNSYKGYTTDPDGFVMALENAEIPLKGRVVILGTGGVARTMAFEAAKRTPDLTFAVLEKDISMCKDLCREITASFPTLLPTITQIDNIQGDIDLLVNATPVGMFPNIESCPVSDKVLARTANVFDAVYNPINTVLVQKARANSSKAISGMSMLVYQAVVSHKIWDGSEYEKEAVEEICRQATRWLADK